MTAPRFPFVLSFKDPDALERMGAKRMGARDAAQDAGEREADE